MAGTVNGMAKRLQALFTDGELVELRRALILIAGEDASANVNMEAEAILDKKSALKKLNAALGIKKQRRKKPSYLDIGALYRGNLEGQKVGSKP